MEASAKLTSVGFAAEQVTTVGERSKGSLKRASRLAVICYGFGDFASQLVWTFVGSYLTVFYSDVVGLAPLALSALMLGTRVLDAVIDPVIGAIAERTITKLGRFRPFILFGCPVLAIFSVLTFTAPFEGTSPMAVIWATVTYGIAGIVYSIVNLPYGALAGAMTENSVQRDEINSSRSIGMNLGMIVVNALTAGLTLFFSGEGAEVADKSGFFMTALVYAVLSIPMFIAVFATSKEVVSVSQAQAKTSFRDTVNALVTNKPLMILTAIIIVQMTAFFGRLSVVSFYVIYCLGSYSMIALIMTIPSVMTVVSSFFVPVLTKRFGKRNSLIGSSIASAAGLVVVWLAPFDNITMVIVGTVIYGLASFGMPLLLGMIADCVDYKDHESHVRTDGTAYGIYSLSTKLGNALGASIGVMLLASVGYVAQAEQSFETLQGMSTVVNLIPAAMFILAAILCLFYNLTESRMAEIRASLDARNTAERATSSK